MRYAFAVIISNCTWLMCDIEYKVLVPNSMVSYIYILKCMVWKSNWIELHIAFANQSFNKMLLCIVKEFRWFIWSSWNQKSSLISKKNLAAHLLMLIDNSIGCCCCRCYCCMYAHFSNTKANWYRSFHLSRSRWNGVVYLYLSWYITFN